VSDDFPVQLTTSRTRTTILADLSDTPRDFPREDVRYGCARVHVNTYTARYAIVYTFTKQEAFEKCRAHSPLRAAARRLL